MDLELGATRKTKTKKSMKIPMLAAILYFFFIFLLIIKSMKIPNPTPRMEARFSVVKRPSKRMIEGRIDPSFFCELYKKYNEAKIGKIRNCPKKLGWPKVEKLLPRN